MKKNFKYLMLALIAVMGFSLTSCNDDDVTLSRKVLASVDVLEYEGIAPDVQIIRIVSDGEWVAEAPEWVSVSPASGSAGETEVEISLSDNLRDGTLDNPRNTNVIFRGRSLDATATVLVKQSGDKYRDPVDYTIDEMEEAIDGTIVKLPGMEILNVTKDGFVATDGSKNIYVVHDLEAPANEWFAPVVGKKVDVIGEKTMSDIRLPYILGGKIKDAGNGTGKQEATVVTSLDNLTCGNYDFISVEGLFTANDNSFSVSGSTNKILLYDIPASLDFSELDGHKLVLNGYFAGSAAPVVRLIPESYTDLGYAETVYFFDDFEWLDPWAEAAGAKDYVAESETLKAQSINLDKKADDGTKLMDVIMLDHGYNFVKATGDRPKKTYEDRPFETRIYLQRNYLKFGLTGIEAGIVLPSIKDIPDGEKVELLFDWSPMRQGDPGAQNRAYDAVELVVIVENGSEITQVPVPAHTLKKGDAHTWMKAQIDLSQFTINEKTKITIRSCDEKWPNYSFAADDPADDGTCKVNRWFIDNIKVRQVMD